MFFTHLAHEIISQLRRSMLRTMDHATLHQGIPYVVPLCPNE